MKKFAVAAVVWAFAWPLCRAELEIQDTPPPPVPAVRQSGLDASNALVQPPKPYVAPAPIVPGTDTDVLKFRNGDQFHGVVLGATPAAGVRWKRADVKDLITFDFDNVAAVELAPRMQAASGSRVAVQLTNGDRLEGELTALDDKTLALKTWYAGALIIKRSVVERLSLLSDLPGASYTGPNSFAEWKSDGNRGAWSFRKGALYSLSPGSISRDVKLPDVAAIDFDLAWRGQLFACLAMGIDPDQQIYTSGGYMLQINYTSIFLQRFHANNGGGNLGTNVELPELQHKSKIHVSIRLNKPKKSIALLIDGSVVKQWNDSDDWCARGTGLALVSQGQGQLRISGIAVTAWDGKLDMDPESSSKAADLVHLNNGDKVSGTVKGIGGGQVALVTSFAAMNVPLERVSHIDFSNQTAERARRNANDVRAFFPNGDHVTFSLEKLDEQNLAGATENCGHLIATLGAFRRVQFHIYDQSSEAADDDNWASPGGGSDGVQTPNNIGDQ